MEGICGLTKRCSSLVLDVKDDFDMARVGLISSSFKRAEAEDEVNADELTEDGTGTEGAKEADVEEEEEEAMLAGALATMSVAGVAVEAAAAAAAAACVPA